jgi:hypothetical protein
MAEDAITPRKYQFIHAWQIAQYQIRRSRSRRDFIRLSGIVHDFALLTMAQ